MKSRACWVLLFLWACPATRADGDELRQLVKARADEINQALLKGDYGKVADLTHPKVVEANGGREKMIETIRTGMRDMKAKGIAFREAKIETPTDFATAGQEMFAVVPFRLVMTARGMKVTQKTFLLGISPDKGKTWTFINGDVGEANVRQLLPSLPKTLKLPKKQDPVIEKNG